jgi:hypothetical protein
MPNESMFLFLKKWGGGRIFIYFLQAYVAYFALKKQFNPWSSTLPFMSKLSGIRQGSVYRIGRRNESCRQ